MKREVSVPENRASVVAAVLLVLSLADIAAAEGPAYQVADIAPNTPTRHQGGTLFPINLQPVADGDVFLAPAGSGPPSIWRTDGTPNGTQPVVAGAALGIGALVGSNGQRAYFAGGFPGRTSAVWATDGTAAGTVLLKGGLGNGGFSSSGPDVAVVDGRLFFHDCHPAPGRHCDLWTSEGTPETTRKIAEVAELVDKVTGSAGKFYFFAPLDEPRPTLFRSDGTAAGTVPLRSFSFASPQIDVTSVGGRAVVVAEQKLWVTDGSSVELVRSLGVNESVDFFNAIVAGAKVYFLVERSNGGTVLDVWSSDGTVAGTSLVLSTNIAFSPVVPSHWAQQLGSRIYFAVPGPQGRDPYALWWSSAQGGTAQPLACSVCSSLEGGLFVLGDELLFPAAAGVERSLWAIDLTHVPRPVATYCSNNFCGVTALVEAAGKAFFLVTPTPGTAELWVTDATTAGTMKLDTFSQALELYGSASADALLFGASRDLQPQTQTSLWTSRGTVQSTTPLTVVEGAGSEPHELRRAGSRIAFLACGDEVGMWGAGAHDAEILKEGSVDCLGSTDAFHPFMSAGGHAFFQFWGRAELWATEGTASSTRKLLEGVGEIVDIASWGDDAAVWTTQVLPNDSRETSLWRSDGTSAGTVRLFDLPTGTQSPSSTVDIGGVLYFRANSPDVQIFRTDGTAAGLRKLTNAPGGENLVAEPEFTRVGAFVFFAGTSGIWRTNGTAAGTSLVVPIAQGGSVSWLHEQGGALLFGRTEAGVTTLWRTQGTPGTTQQVAPIAPAGPQFFLDRRAVVSFDGLLYFAADDGAHGVELWRTDGTTAGTVLVRDIGIGPVSGNPRHLVVANGLIYFTADDTFTGSELWVSDGTSAGTHLLQDIAPQAASSAPAELTVVGDLIYFSADDGVTGRELWALPLEAPQPCSPTEGRLCLHGDRFRLEVAWRDFAGNTGSGHAVALTTDTGYFWFFDSANVELTVKVLDGRGVNGHHWVFYGALSSVEYTLTVTDTQTGAVRRYVNPAGTLASVADTAFPRGDGLAGAAAAVAAGTAKSRPGRVTSTAVPPAPCVATSLRLCLQGGRFAVEAVWQDFAGNQGVGTAVRLTGDTGYFWFFGESNVEVVLKVLDGRPVNGKFWVFYGALSSVEYTLTVTDTETGLQKQYHNPSGRLASIADTSAF